MPSKQINDFVRKGNRKNELVARPELGEELVENVCHGVEGVVARRVHPLLVTAFVRVVLDNVENPE